MLRKDGFRSIIWRTEMLCTSQQIDILFPLSIKTYAREIQMNCWASGLIVRLHQIESCFLLMVEPFANSKEASSILFPEWACLTLTNFKLLITQTDPMHWHSSHQIAACAQLSLKIPALNIGMAIRYCGASDSISLGIVSPIPPSSYSRQAQRVWLIKKTMEPVS